jgi:O-antigen ligase
MIVVTFFFLLLGVLVFLGDGKQQIVDVIATAGIISQFVFLKMRNERTASLGRTLSVLWSVLFLYLLSRTVFSDSVGFSVSSAIRWVMAYLTFVLAASVPIDKKALEKISWLYVWFGALMIVIAGLISFFPLAGQLLPAMNLLYPAFGHNHAVNIVIFIFPIILHAFLAQKSIKNWLFLATCVAGLLLSFARGAWVVFVGYLSYIVLSSPIIAKRLRLGVIGAIALLSSLFLFGFFSISQAHIPKAFERFFLKPSVVESRLPYWQQAGLAIQERPFIGSGLGTFSLLSRRFQHAPNNHSWYAHSFLLELLAETGVIGALLVASVLGYIMFFSVRGPLFQSIVLTLVYSLVEINLNFLVVWLLLWFSLGLVWRARGFKVARRDGYLTTISIAICICVYVGSLSATILSTHAAMQLYAFYAEPYNVSRALKTVSLSGVSQPVLGGIEYFFDKDPDVVAALAKFLPVSQIDSQKQQSLWLKAISLDPQNVELATDGMRSMAQTNNPKGVGLALSLLSSANTLSKDMHGVATVNFSGGAFDTVYTTSFVSYLGRPTTTRELLAKAYYFMGMWSLPQDPELTRVLWGQSRSLAPQWGHFHVELAALYQYYLSDETQAKAVLKECLLYSSAAAQCQEVLEQGIPPAGHHVDDIRLIPLTSAQL